MIEFLRRMWAAPKVRIGGAVFLAVLLFGLIAPVCMTTKPTDSVGTRYEAPSPVHRLGTDHLGRDMLTNLAYGTRTSLGVGLLAGLVATLLGTAMGAVAGYKGGRIDGGPNPVTNPSLVSPPVVALIQRSTSLRTRSVLMLAVIIGLTSWSWVSRSVRAQVYSLKTRRHVDIARISGFGTIAIVVREILPYILSYMVMAFVLQVAYGLLNDAPLRTLGLRTYETL